MNDGYDSANIVRQWLRDHNIPFTSEQSFEGLKGEYGAYSSYDEALDDLEERLQKMQ